MVVDYSKWDKFGLDDDDEDDDDGGGGGGGNNGNTGSHPQGLNAMVTKLDGPSRITIPAKGSGTQQAELIIHGGNGGKVMGANFNGSSPAAAAAAITNTAKSLVQRQEKTELTLDSNQKNQSKYSLNYSKWDELVKEIDQNEELDEPKKEYYEDEFYHKQKEMDRLKQEAKKEELRKTMNKGKHEIKDKELAEKKSNKTMRSTTNLVINGKIENTYFWNQNETHVIIYVPINGTRKAKQISVELAKDDGTLTVNCDSETMLSRKLEHDVWGSHFEAPLALAENKDKTFHNSMTWELVDIEETYHKKDPNGNILSRAIMITLTKYMMSDLLRTIWWTRAFRDGPEDPIDLTDRHRKGTIDSFQSAEQLFKQKLMQETNSS